MFGSLFFWIHGGLCYNLATLDSPCAYFLSLFAGVSGLVLFIAFVHCFVYWGAISFAGLMKVDRSLCYSQRVMNLGFFDIHRKQT